MEKKKLPDNEESKLESTDLAAALTPVTEAELPQGVLIEKTEISSWRRIIPT